MTGYQAGDELIELITSDEVISEFLDSFLDRATGDLSTRRPLATIAVSGDVLDATPAVAVHGTVVLAGGGQEFRVGRRSPDVPLDMGELLGVLRKLVREIWLADQAPDGDYWYLHASAVDNGCDVIVFVGDKRNGKTTMMLDAVAGHGYRLLTNDGLLFVRSGSDLVMAPLPTLAKIRGDVVARFLPFLTTRPLDPFNARQLHRWHLGGMVGEKRGAGRGTLFLTFGALGRKFAAVRVSDRRVTVVGVRFGQRGAPPRLADLAPQAATTLVERNRKDLPVFFGDLVGFVPATPDRQRRLVEDLVKQVDIRRFRHAGDAGPLLASLGETG
jgi:hypothetical protein